MFSWDGWVACLSDEGLCWIWDTCLTVLWFLLKVEVWWLYWRVTLCGFASREVGLRGICDTWYGCLIFAGSWVGKLPGLSFVGFGCYFWLFWLKHSPYGCEMTGSLLHSPRRFGGGMSGSLLYSPRIGEMSGSLVGVAGGKQLGLMGGELSFWAWRLWNRHVWGPGVRNCAR